MVVLKAKSEEVISGLLALGMFHPVDIRHVEDELAALSVFQVEKEYAQWEAVQINVREIARTLRLTPQPNAPLAIQTDTFETVQARLDQVQAKITPLVEQRDGLIEELKTKESMFSQIKEYFPIPVKRGSFYTFLETSVGKIEEKNIPALERSLKDVPHLFYPFNKDAHGKIIVLVIGLRRDRVFLDKVLRDFAWEKVEYPPEFSELPSDVDAKMRAQILDYKERIRKVDLQMQGLARESRATLSQVHSLTCLKKSLLEAKRYSCITEKTVLLAGWVPLEEKAAVIAAIRKIDPSFYVENRRPEEVNIPKDEIPVRLKHNPLLKPFEPLVEAYGLPRYGTVDPTIFVAISFLAMFGAMFGDLGHGLVLVLASFFLNRSAKEGVKRASVILLYCGVSSAIFGTLYGCVFGLEFPSVWIKPMENIMELFRLSIFFGMGFLTLGILINIINALRDRDYLKAVFDKAGLIVGIIYWLAIGGVTKYLVSRAPASPAVIKLIAAGVVLLFLKPVIESFFHKSKENIAMLFMENTVEILEIFVGYLSNTVSFMRIAAYAITHTSLFLAIFELSRALKDAGFIVIILGNIMIILLEGLVSSIQAIRLNYYEFFSKFFVTGKYSFRPLK